jgi:hypothetical protein
MAMRRSQKVVVSIAVVLLVVGGIWWSIAAAQSPTAVFNAMLANNLSTPSVTRVVQQNGSGLSVSQYTQMNFTQQPTAHALTIFKQNGGSIATEEISDSKSDFVRYQKIVATAKTKDGKNIDVSNVVGQWAKLNAGSGLGTTVTSGLFEQSLLGVLPIGNLRPAMQQQLLTYIHDKQIFTYDASKVKTTNLGGRKVYEYAVSIAPQPYIVLMQTFGKQVGASQFASLDPNAYAQAAKVQVTLKIDARSHTLAELNETSAGRVESYQGYGVIANTDLPKATLTTQELTDRLGKLQ